MRSMTRMAGILAGVAVLMAALAAPAATVSFDPVLMPGFEGGTASGLLAYQNASSGRDEPSKTEEYQPPPDWGGFGGPMIQLLYLDLSPLDPMTHDRGLDRFDNQLLLIGGLGGAIHKNLRFGGFGFGSSGQDRSESGPGGERTAEISFGGGGVFVEYQRPLRDVAGILAGAMLGAGGMSVKAEGADLGKTYRADAAFAMATPYVGVWLAPVSWFWVELDAGYNFFSADTTELESDSGLDLADGDLSGGFQYGLKLIFGANPNQ